MITVPFTFLTKILHKPTSDQKGRQKDHIQLEKPLTGDLAQDLEVIKQAFHSPRNQDLSIRSQRYPGLTKAIAIVYLEAMTNEKTISNHVLRPLNSKQIAGAAKGTLDTIAALLEIRSKGVRTYIEAVEQILTGRAVLLVDGESEALQLDTVGFSHRAVEKPQNETVIKGPHEGFVEDAKTNRSLIRKTVRDQNLVNEAMVLGKRTKTPVQIMYIDGVANPRLVEQVKQRLSDITADIPNLSVLEQYIEDRPYSILPSVLWTELPDRASAFLREGHVVLIDNSAGCLIVPVTFWSFFHTSEDFYERWAYANFIRIVRFIALHVAVFTPAVYIAFTTYHAEMIPTDLLLAIAGTREVVPFPALVELLIMEVAFELLREAGVRIPSPLGSTIGIVGALILGQAAVEANLVSPILVIVVAITGLASFALPNVSLGFAARLARFTCIVFASFFGVVGIGFFAAVGLAYMSTFKSFDVPFLAPIAPNYCASHDMVIRSPVWKQWLRPFHIKPQDQERQAEPEPSNK